MNAGLPDGREITLRAWNGTHVQFHPKDFDHAFSESSDYRFGSGDHNIPFSHKRARCLLWIKEALTASKGIIERRQHFRKDGRGKLKKRRVLIVVEERYVVVLEERNNPETLKFITAFPAEETYLKKIRKESLLLETKKPQS